MMSVSNALRGVVPNALKYQSRSSLLLQRGYLSQSFLQLQNAKKAGSKDNKSNGRSARQSFATKLVTGTTPFMHLYLFSALVNEECIEYTEVMILYN